MSGGRITLGIYIAIGLIPVCVGPAAVGQQSAHPKNVPTPVGLQTMRSDGWLPPNERTPERVALQPVPTITTVPVPEKVVMSFGEGGSIPAHQMRFNSYRLTNTRVELRGPCYSACTVITSYVAKENLCIAEGAFMAFHAARWTMDGPIHGPATIAMYDAYPIEIRHWIDRHGGVGKLPRDGYWTMYDRDLWAMGYPKCK